MVIFTTSFERFMSYLLRAKKVRIGYNKRLKIIKYIIQL